MPSSEMLHRVTHVRTEVSEEHSASIIRLSTLGQLRTTLAVASTTQAAKRSVLRLLVTANVIPRSPILVTLMMEVLHFSETSDLTRVTQSNNPKDGILQVDCIFKISY
jgi:hypothetical protein